MFPWLPPQSLLLLCRICRSLMLSEGFVGQIEQGGAQWDQEVLELSLAPPQWVLARRLPPPRFPAQWEWVLAPAEWVMAPAQWVLARRLPPRFPAQGVLAAAQWGLAAAQWIHHRILKRTCTSLKT